MKKVVLAIRNTLVCEAVAAALHKRGFFVERSLSQQPERVAAACDAFFADILLMDVNRTGDGIFDTRMETVRRVRQKDPSVKAGLICDNTSDPEIAFRVKQAKEAGAIDVFFYESVQTDYLCDVVDSL